MCRLVKTCCILLLATFAGQAMASSIDTPSGLPIPRFVNLKYDQVWGRVGPSQDYPVRYELTRQGLPLRVVAETRDDAWRKVEDVDGATMWIHRSQLVSANKALVTKDGALLRARREEGAAVRAKLQAGVIVRFDACDDSWCAVEAGGFRGYIETAALWGVAP